MAKTTSEDVVLREIRPEDGCSGLSLGDAAFQPLKSFLSGSAKRFQTQNLARSYVFATQADKPSVVAYITLLCSQITIEENEPAVEDYAYSDLPAVKIARLAVDRRHRGNQLGMKLVEFGIAVTRDLVMPHVGCRFIVVDSKQASIGFYRKMGFVLLDTDANRGRPNPVMFLDVGKL